MGDLFDLPTILALCDELFLTEANPEERFSIAEEALMNEIDRERRALLFGVGGVGVNQLLSQGAPWAQTAAPEGYVLGANAGEHLIHFRDHGQIFIKAGSATGSENLGLGTQQVIVGAGIPVHRHLRADEAFYVLGGSGVFIHYDVEHPFETGGTIFIPKNSWHSFTNADHELLLLWIMSPAGLDGFFRETCTPPGVPPKQLTREQISVFRLDRRPDSGPAEACTQAGEMPAAQRRSAMLSRFAAWARLFQRPESGTPAGQLPIQAPRLSL